LAQTRRNELFSLVQLKHLVAVGNDS
jgi:hypothetical protein